MPSCFKEFTILSSKSQLSPYHSFSNSYNQRGVDKAIILGEVTTTDLFHLLNPRLLPTTYLDSNLNVLHLSMTFINRTNAYMTKIDAHLACNGALLQSQATLLENLETLVGQIAQAVSSHPSGTFPSDTMNNQG